MRFTMTGSTLTLALLIANAALGQQQQQQQPSQTDDAQGGGGAVMPPPIYSSGDSYYTASSAVEGGLRGSAAIIRAAGEYNYNTAAGMAAAAAAASQGIANEAAALNGYFALKYINDNYQARHRGTQMNGNQIARISRVMAPKRLSTYQLDAYTGEILWPAILDRRWADPYRQRLEALFSHRERANSGLGTPTYEEIVELTNAFQRELKGRIETMTPAEYVVAKRFLTSLGYEAQFTPVMDGVASN